MNRIGIYHKNNHTTTLETILYLNLFLNGNMFNRWYSSFFPLSSTPLLEQVHGLALLSSSLFHPGIYLHELFTCMSRSTVHGNKCMWIE